MNKPYLFSLLIIFAFTVANAFPSAKSLKSPKPPAFSIIPKPAKLIQGEGSFALSPATKIVYEANQQEQKTVVAYFVRQMEKATGYRLEARETVELPKTNFISLLSINDKELGLEGYRVAVEQKDIRVSANAGAGFFYAVQTLLQLLPPEAFGTKPLQRIEWKIPCVSIEDSPRFPWRGMHLDVSRHFFSKDFIKTYIDMLAMHKMNVFHWHLTDDQGWRIEIKKYPKLTDVAAWRVDREHQQWSYRDPQGVGEKATYGGFYTQDEVREIVKYAAEKNITVVPEIEMPAHTTALLVAYPQYSCTGGPFAVPPGGVWPITDIFCAGKDSTFSFLEDVLTEVMDLFPSTFIHIGGDEADKKEWRVCPQCQARIKNERLKDESDLQSYFVKRIERFLNSRNRRLIGWDEILEGGIAPNAAVMSWRGTEGGIAAAREGHDAVMTPASHCYFNSYQGKEELEPLAGGGYLPLRTVYAYEPVPDELTPDEAQRILGAQGCVWTEFIMTPEQVQYMTLPRLAALAEAVWSPKEVRNWTDFAARVERQMKRYEAAGYTYARSAYLVSISTSVDSIKKWLNVAMTTEVSDQTIYYTVDGKDPTPSSRRYVRTIGIDKTSTIRAGAFRGGKLLGKVSEQKVYLHKASFKPVRLKDPYEKYTGGGEYGLTNGLRGSTSFDDGNWQGYHQVDLDATVDLGKVNSLSRIATSFLEKTISWIFFPTSVEFSVSDDGVRFVPVAKFEEPVPTAHRPPAIKEFSQKLSKAKARYVRIQARNVGICPDWHLGKGDKAWLFVDEIIVE